MGERGGGSATIFFIFLLYSSCGSLRQFLYNEAGEAGLVHHLKSESDFPVFPYLFKKEFLNLF